MQITQDTLINQIADREKIQAATVRQIFKSAETIIFDYLSSVTPSETITIKIANGIHVERNYVEGKRYSKGMFQNIDCPAHVNAKACLSKYYNTRINRKLFGK